MDTVPLEVEDPIAAATHAAPYPFYAHLVAERPLAWDATHRLWVAASAEAVRAVLSHPACRVRPPSEPVPSPIATTAMGGLYARWLRMTEGAASREGKRAVATALEALSPEAAGELGSRVCRALDSGTTLEPGAVTEFAFAVPLHVVGQLLGLPSAVLPSVARATRRLAEGVSPLASPAEREAGARAAAELVETLARSEGGLLMELLSGVATQQRLEPEWVRANAIGLLFQTCEATAGLIGNTLLALARAPDWLAKVREQPELLPATVEEVIRFDPPVQNTRRFLAEDARVLETPMQAGQGILVLLAAANRDPSIHTDPHRFDPKRPGQRSFTFGSGSHACPGSRLAVTVAARTVGHLLERGVEPGVLARSYAYRPSHNGRIPLFTAPSAGGSA
ncbi:cytochrome P450 [Pyxidicoccus fallax]|uniref:Cytochrome P450 n=1 Tax=Pyxidicoccus fallax TaxID=394095 RepID=A0A848LJT5_9BACT|nr:cytochrome P450 [Pyxidicoccus fallax]NMO17958.1 cytochrome P450 [Pyxidicoccus fallax]NPC78989.1 cytochrome P450 [Pyxidicoccus fallax]